jgi:hypothetical protein
MTAHLPCTDESSSGEYSWDHSLLVKATQKQQNSLDVNQIWSVSLKMSQQLDSKNLQSSSFAFIMAKSR